MKKDLYPCHCHSSHAHNGARRSKMKGEVTENSMRLLYQQKAFAAINFAGLKSPNLSV